LTASGEIVFIDKIKEIDGWVLGKALGSGKSAEVYAAVKNGQDTAVKIFNPELVERYGRETQLGRIKRELSLVGVQHDHLIQIFGGGECQKSGFL
jgi:eukaryotic-like serine/threonine-protein kinase